MLVRALRWAKARTLSLCYRLGFWNRHYVFRRVGPFESPGHREWRVESYRNVDEIPQAVREMIASDGGEKALKTTEEEIKSFAVLWVAFDGAIPVAMNMSRRGCYFQNWFVPLDDADIVIFRAKTFPKYRGRGIAPALTDHILYEELRGGGSAYGDCHIHNKASIRAIQKNGLQLIGEMRPITREYALGREGIDERPSKPSS